MKKLLLTFGFLTIILLGYSQNAKSIYPNFIGQNANEIENNSKWKILIKASGDLNKDGIKDTSLILESRDSIVEKKCSNCKLMKIKPRIILVLLNQNDQEKVIIQNNVFIARGDEGGMLPYLEPELSIENGLLTLYYQYTRDNRSYTFEFKNDKMRISMAENMDLHSATGNFVLDKYDFNKGIITVQKGNTAKEKIRTETFKIMVKSKSLSEFGKMYSWQVVEHKNL